MVPEIFLYFIQACRKDTKDDQGRVIADYIDYALAYQLINEHFQECLSQNEIYTDDKIKIIEKHGMIKLNELASLTGSSASNISQWSKRWIEKGILIWVNENGQRLCDQASLKKAKHSGKAYLKVTDKNKLPTPFQLTGDPSWDVDGELYKKYDLGFEPFEYEPDVKMEPLIDVDDFEEPGDRDKVFSDKSLDEIKNNEKELNSKVLKFSEHTESLDPEIITNETKTFDDQIAEIFNCLSR